VAAELARAGHEEAAAHVRRLAKPSPAVWAVNQLARRDRVGIERLLQAGARLRAAQGGAGAELADATDAHRRALGHLSDQARRLLVEAGFAGTDAMVERVAATLLGAASDQAAVDDLRRGRLAGELARPGFEVLASGAAAATRPPAAPRRPPARAPRSPAAPVPPEDGRRAALERRLEDARAALRQAETEAAERARHAEAAARTAGEARRAAAAARKAAMAAARAVRATEAALARWTR
jgi:hypothetical protein